MKRPKAKFKIGQVVLINTPLFANSERRFQKIATRSYKKGLWIYSTELRWFMAESWILPLTKKETGQ